MKKPLSHYFVASSHNTYIHISCLLFLLVFIFIGNLVIAQTPTVQDCLGAIPICAQTYTETTSPSGAGNYPNEVNGTSQGGICCMDNELNSIWYTFTVNQSGLFGFTLTPNNLSDDYDWAMFDITDLVACLQPTDP